MKNAVKIILILFLVSSCTSSRYFLTKSGNDKKYLILKIRDYQKKGELVKRPNIIVDGKLYRYEYELKTKKLNFSKDEIYTIKLLNTPGDGNVSHIVEIITKGHQKTNPDEVIVFCDLKRITDQEMQAMNPNDISAIDVIKSDSALSSIGYQDFGSVMYITTKKYAIEQYRNNYSKISSDYMNFIKDIPLENEINLISYFHNGKKIDRNSPEYEILLLSQKNLMELELITDGTILKKFGEDTKKGIILIKTE